MRGVLVTATDTGVGKTVLSASIVAAMAAAGERVRAYKPVLTGLDEHVVESDGPASWPRDHELLAAAAGMLPDEVAPLRYGPAVSPHLAAALAKERIDPAQLLAHATARASETLVVEGTGGLMTPLTEHFTVRDLAAALGLPVLIAARPGVGTINHTLLTIDAARAADLDVRAVILTPWPSSPSRLELSNRDTIAAMREVAVVGLATVRTPDPSELARAGAKLPWRDWLGGEPVASSLAVTRAA